MKIIALSLWPLPTIKYIAIYTRAGLVSREYLVDIGGVHVVFRKVANVVWISGSGKLSPELVVAIDKIINRIPMNT